MTKAADRARWKSQERDTAKLLGGTRVPNQGVRSVDILHPHLWIEHKARKTIPEWWSKALGALAPCPPEKLKLLIFAWTPGQGRRIERWAIMPFDDFLRLTRKAGLTPDDHADDFP